MIENKTPHIRIVFVRNGYANNEAMDDYIIIKHKGENMFHVYYHDAFKASDRHDFTVVSAHGLDTYLFSLFAMISRDASPFREVQIDIPCMPSVMYKPEQLNGRRLMEALSHMMPILSMCSVVHIHPKAI